MINKVSDLVNELVAGLSEFGPLHFDRGISFWEHIAVFELFIQ
jgi:hypothetical protein